MCPYTCIRALAHTHRRCVHVPIPIHMLMRVLIHVGMHRFIYACVCTCRVMRCHPYLRSEIMAAQTKNTEKAIQRCDVLWLKHAGFITAQIARLLWNGLTGGRFIRAPKKDKSAYYYRQISRLHCRVCRLLPVWAGVLVFYLHMAFRQQRQTLPMGPRSVQSL